MPLQKVSAGFHVRAGHPLARMPTVTLADLDGYLLARPARGNSFGELSPSKTIACKDCWADRVGLRRGYGGDESFGSTRTEARSLAPLSGPQLPLQFAPIGVVHRSGRTLSAFARRFIENFRVTLSELESVGSGMEGDG